MVDYRNKAVQGPESNHFRQKSSENPVVPAKPVQGFWQTAARIRPGPKAIQIGILLVVLSLIHFLFPWQILLYLIALITAVLFVMTAIEAVKLSRCLGQLNVRRLLPTVVGRNSAFTISWEIENNGEEDLQGELRDVTPVAATPRFSIHHFDIAARGGRVSLTHVCRISERGLHTFGPVWIRLCGPRRLVEVQRVFEIPARIKVLPEQFASRDELLKDRGAELLLLDKATQSRQHGAGTEFESLTEFRDGDDPRRIDWRSTARLQRPVVRRFQIERHRDVMILVDCGRLMGTETDRGTKLDCAVDAGLILARVTLQSGDRCGMGLYDNEVRSFLPPVAGIPSLHALTDNIYAAQSNFRETDFGPMFAMLQSRQVKRSLIVVISDISDEETSLQFRASLGRLARRHVVLVAALRTPLLNRILRSPIETMIDGAKVAVTFRLLRERQLALQSLKHSGVFVLDVEPNQLTVPLVNRFIELRQRNLM
jgi:uncharacterized protein (DUF58 family)